MAFVSSTTDRASYHAKQRDKMKEKAEQERLKIAQKHQVEFVATKFSGSDDPSAVEAELRQRSYGLRTLGEMKKDQEDLEAARAQQVAAAAARAAGKRAKKKKKRKAATLSFDLEDGDGDGGDGMGDGDSGSGGVGGGGGSPVGVVKKARLGMCPEVDTTGLPDVDRQEQERQERERLRKEWVEAQEKAKNEPIEITYSYWDGSGHRHAIAMKKGDTIEKFLQSVLMQLRPQYPELRAVSTENLMYIKEDLIMPINYTFYDFIVTKARGKSGPLFNFGVFDDVRAVTDIRIEKNESHAGKVILRSWYNQNKHIFPASRWEPWDPEADYGDFTIKDRNKKREI